MHRLLSCVLLLAPLAAAAAETEAETVEAILAAHAEARGGAEKIRALRTLVYSQGLYEEGDYVGNGGAMMAFTRPHYKVVGNPDDPGSYLEGYDGSAWEWLGDPGIVVRTVGAASAASRHGADLEGPLIDPGAKGVKVELGEPEAIGGRPAHRLVVTLRDGFVREYFVDRETYLVTAERMSAPIHAFGEPVTGETRIRDYRPAVGSGGVLFAHAYDETEIATGRLLSRMRWGRIEANRELPAAWFSPPRFERTPLQRFLEQLFAERADPEAVRWSYADFRRAHPEVDSAHGVEVVGYQMLKMDAFDGAIALLEANAADHPGSADAAFGLGRAYRSAGRLRRARAEYARALELEPEHSRAQRAVDEMDSEPPPAVALAAPLAFLAPYLGSWYPDPESDFVRDHPERADWVAFRIERGDPAGKIVRFYEGIPAGEFDRRILENLVTFNPRTGEVVALGFQLEDDYLYESTFRPADAGFVREYRVTYPPEQAFRREEDRQRGWIRYRDRCHSAGADRLRCVTEQLRDGEWQPWGHPDGFVTVRR